MEAKRKFDFLKSAGKKGERDGLFKQKRILLDPETTEIISSRNERRVAGRSFGLGEIVFRAVDISRQIIIEDRLGLVSQVTGLLFGQSKEHQVGMSWAKTRD
jgi:hypothetical protein